MIFNTFSYFILFLIPAAVLFRMMRPAIRPWICVGFGGAFFIFFSLTQVGGAAGASCLLIFVWESIFSRFYKTASILCFPTMVAGPIKRYQDFLPKLIHPSRQWTRDWRQAFTRILAGLVKKFMVADLLTAFTNHFNRTDIAQAQRWVLPIWLLAY